MNETLGTHLKDVRKQRNLTLRAVEGKTGISNAYLSQLENNKISFPSPKFLNKLAALYEVSYEQLMKLAGYPVSADKEQALAFRLESSFGDLTPDEKTKVQEYIQFLKSKRR
jgi:transcriptional regulator with XRE-family HTH domain